MISGRFWVGFGTIVGPCLNQKSQNDDPGQPYGLALTDSGDNLVVMPAGDGTPLAQLAYGSENPTNPAAADTSLTLTPDVTGTEYKAHSEASSIAYSPGTYADGSNFVGPEGRYLTD